jgi:hypothetical protein
MLMAAADELLKAIACEHLGVETLETRNSDTLDFHDVSVWGVKNALQAAYQAGVNDCQGTTFLERRIAEQMQAALTGLLDDLSEVGEDRHPETGEEYASVAFARAVLATTKVVSSATDAGTTDLPIVIVTVRGGLIEDMDATIAITAVVEDWDVEDFDTGKKPARNVWALTSGLSSKREA